MRRRRISLAVGSALLVVAAAPVLADSNVRDVPPHRHFIVKPNGTFVEVGPRVCDNPNLQEAFNQFHVNVHLGTPGEFAFDHLHDNGEVGNPVDITARGCSFVP